MKFSQVWTLFCNKYPKLRSPSAEVTIRADQLKSLLEQAFEKGRDDVIESKSSTVIDDLMDKFCGRR